MWGCGKGGGGGVGVLQILLNLCAQSVLCAMDLFLRILAFWLELLTRIHGKIR